MPTGEEVEILTIDGVDIFRADTAVLEKQVVTRQHCAARSRLLENELGNPADVFQSFYYS